MAESTRVILSVLILSVCQASDIFDNALTDSDICSQNCSGIYKITGPLEGCNRGCRFHVIEEFVSTDLNSSQLNTACYGDCIESYGENSPRTTACKDGCDIQQKFVADLKKKEEDESPSIHLLSPFMQVRAVYSSFVGAVKIVRSSLITYFVRDDDKIIAVESEPEFILGIDVDAVNDEQNQLLSRQQQQKQMSRELPLGDGSDEPSVVKCVSRQIGVPPYILMVSMVAIFVFIMYVIIAMCHTSNVSKAKAFANGKGMNIDPMPLPVKLVRPEDLTKLSLTEEDELQAPPLPTKLKLPDTLI